MLVTLAAGAAGGAIGNRRLWTLSRLVMAVGVALPVALPGLVPLLVAAFLVGATFMVITMAGMQEARAVAGPHAGPVMVAMTAAFALGQIAGPWPSAPWRRPRGISAPMTAAQDRGMPWHGSASSGGSGEQPPRGIS